MVGAGLLFLCVPDDLCSLQKPQSSACGQGSQKREEHAKTGELQLPSMTCFSKLGSIPSRECLQRFIQRQ